MILNKYLFFSVLLVFSACSFSLNVYGKAEENDGADIGSASTHVSHACEVPDSLDKLKIVFVTDPGYAPSNPFADTLIEMDFTRRSYVFVELIKRRSFIGAYRYRKLAHNVGYLEGKDTIGSQILRYSISVVA